MPRSKVNDEDLRQLASLYNTEGRTAVYELLRTRYDVKNPYFVVRRMLEDTDLSYHAKDDCFHIQERPNPESVFLSMDELCIPVKSQHINVQEKQAMDSRPAAMEKLIQELIGDRLLELSRYVTLDSLSKTVIVDRSSLTTDGYQLVTH